MEYYDLYAGSKFPRIGPSGRPGQFNELVRLSRMAVDMARAAARFVNGLPERPAMGEIVAAMRMLGSTIEAAMKMCTFIGGPLSDLKMASAEVIRQTWEPRAPKDRAGLLQIATMSEVPDPIGIIVVCVMLQRDLLETQPPSEVADAPQDVRGDALGANPYPEYPSGSGRVLHGHSEL